MLEPMLDAIPPARGKRGIKHRIARKGIESSRHLGMCNNLLQMKPSGVFSSSSGIAQQAFDLPPDPGPGETVMDKNEGCHVFPSAQLPGQSVPRRTLATLLPAKRDQLGH